MSGLESARRALRELIDRGDLDRGYAYAREGRARISAERREGLEIEIESSCIGSRATPYTQKLLLGFDEAGRIEYVDGQCSCPVEVDCKHVACAALTWLATKPPLLPHGGTRGSARLSEEPEPIFLAPDAEEWLRQFGRSLKRPGSEQLKGECVCYRLSEDARSLQIAKGRILKDKRLTALASLTPDFHWLRNGREPPRYVGPLDLPVFECVALLPWSPDYRGWSLDGALGAKALESALATGRLRLGDGEEWRTYAAGRTELRLDTDGWLKSGAALEASLVLQNGPPGDMRRGMRWAARCRDRAHGDEIVPIPVSPPWYLDKARGEIGRLDIAGPQPAILQLLRMPEIDPESGAVFLSALRGIARDAGMEEIAAQVPESAALRAAPPRARLRIARGVFRDFGRGRAPDQTRWIAELWFDYPQGLALPDAERTAPGVRWRDSSGVERVALRDVDAERVVRQKLAAAGCVFRPPHGDGRFYRLDAQRPFAWPDDGSERGWNEGVQKLFEAAYAAGAEIDCHKDFPHLLREAGELYEDIAAAAAGWFDLDLGVMVDGKRVSLVGPIVEWIRRTPDVPGWLEAADSQATVMLKVESLGLLRLPAERLKRLLTPLLDTFGFERAPADGRLRLSRIEAALLPEVPVAAHGVPSDLARLRERLGDFRGIRPAPPAAGFRARLAHADRARRRRRTHGKARAPGAALHPEAHARRSARRPSRENRDRPARGAGGRAARSVRVAAHRARREAQARDRGQRHRRQPDRDPRCVAQAQAGLLRSAAGEGSRGEGGARRLGEARSAPRNAGRAARRRASRAPLLAVHLDARPDRA